MKDKIDTIINERLQFLRQDDKESLKSDILNLLNIYYLQIISLEKKVEVLNSNLSKKTTETELEALKKENKKLLNKIEFLNEELNSKFNKKESQTIAFQLGESIINSIKNPKKAVKTIPNTTASLFKESIIRKSKKSSAKKLDKILGILLETNLGTNSDNRITNSSDSITKDIQPNKSLDFIKTETIRKYIDINKDFSRISYDYGVNSWPKKIKNVRFISVLDEISETSWSEEFKLFRLVKKNFVEQLEASTADALFIESCWKGNQGEWEYAFTSPGLKHQNAQNLLKALEVAKSKSLPIMFWNKEDPMHYEKFLPIAEKCDIIFTTDSNKVNDYKKDLGHDNVHSLPFAANPYICNPMNRSRYEEESICFAGSYYSVGHDERKRQMDDMLPVLLDFDGVIYDRMSKLNNDRYKFPEIYENIIRDSVGFKDMTALYKHFKLFLNVNTITDSPTMMSRRVYELLACGTPVISTPSLALEKQFSNIVQIANNANEAKAIIHRLLNNTLEYDRLSHLGYREVMLKHTYENRKTIINKALGIDVEQEIPMVSIIMCTCRSHLIDRIVENISRQNYTNIEVVFVLQDFTSLDKNKLSRLMQSKAKKIQTIKYLEINDEDVLLGSRFNKAFDISNGGYIAKMDDDDYYFENYLTDMLIPFKFGDYGMVGKKEVFMYLEESNKIIRRYPNQRHQNTDFVAGPTFIIKREVLELVKFEDRNTGEDSSFISNIKDKGYKIYSADPFNFIQFRGKNHKHTWKVMDIELLSGKQTEIVYDYYCEDFIRF